MNIRGLYKTSLVDYPGKISTVIFTGGCNMRCGFCHNPDLALNSRELPVHSEEDVLQYLASRKGLIDGVVLSGGEPTLNEDIVDFALCVGKLGLPVKLDTNGMLPEVVESLLASEAIEYAALDIKTSPSLYSVLTGVEADFYRIAETANLLKKSGIEYELRTTCVPGYVNENILREIGGRVGKVGKYYLQQFAAGTTLLGEEYSSVEPLHTDVLRALADVVRDFADICEVRGI